ncbi:MAG TPA: hypothetical protein VGM77_13950 [Gemmatimonadales bacterium]
MTVVRPLALAALILPLFSACSSSGSTDNTGGGATLSATEAPVVASAIFSSAFSALSSATFSSLKDGRAMLVQPTATFNAPCTGGGSISGSLNLTNSLNGQGTGSEAYAMSINENSCAVSTGTRTITVGGTLTFNFNMSLVAYALTAYTATATGNFTWSGGSCAINYTVTMNGAGHYGISGSLCGVSISASY